MQVCFANDGSNDDECSAGRVCTCGSAKSYSSAKLSNEPTEFIMYLIVPLVASVWDYVFTVPLAILLIVPFYCLLYNTVTPANCDFRVFFSFTNQITLSTFKFLTKNQSSSEERAYCQRIILMASTSRTHTFSYRSSQRLCFATR